MKNKKQKNYKQMREGDFSNCTDIDLMRDAIKYLQRRSAEGHNGKQRYCGLYVSTLAEKRQLTLQLEALESSRTRTVYDEAWIQKKADEITLKLLSLQNEAQNKRDANKPYIPPHLPKDALDLSSSSDAIAEIRRNHYGEQIPYEQVVDMAMNPNIKEPERTHYIKVLESAKAMAERLGLPIEKIRFNLFDSGLIKIHEPF